MRPFLSFRLVQWKDIQRTGMYRPQHAPELRSGRDSSAAFGFAMTRLEDSVGNDVICRRSSDLSLHVEQS